MEKGTKQFYLVDFQVLPSALKNTIRAKELLKNDTAETINEAVKKTGISRSAYYKYKDHVAPAFEDSMYGVATLFIIMQNDPALGNKIFRRLGRARAEVMTMHKGIAVKKLTTMSFSIQTAEMVLTLSELVDELRSLKGVKEIYVVKEE